MRIELRNVTVRYGATAAVYDVTTTLAGCKIYGLLGRNGAGKTTLLSVLSAFRRPSAGQVLIDGRPPFENATLVQGICFIRDRLDAPDDERVSAVLDFARALRPDWDEAYAQQLLETFQLPLRARVGRLSRGQKSALGLTLGLATRAPLTILDESYLGLDAPSRAAFYDSLLQDYLANPRTFILSTHLIEEVAALLEEVLVLHRGRLLMHEQAETFRARGVAVTGPVEAVDRFVEGLTVLSTRRLGPTKSATVFGRLGPERELAARTLGLELGRVGLQDLITHLTSDDAATLATKQQEVRR